MCVYTKQHERLSAKYPPFKDQLKKAQLPQEITWLEDPEYLAVDRPEFSKRSPVIGIGNWGTIMFQNEHSLFWDWAQFAPARSMWPGGKAMPYYNAKVETLEGYDQGLKKGPFPKAVLDDLQNRSCVFWVNSFFESNGNKTNPRWFHIKPQSLEFIPLAGFFHIMDDPDQGSAWPAFTIVTRDPYDLVAETGHPRSPAILSYSNIEGWLNPSNPVRTKLELLAEVPNTEFVIDEVERYSVTKKTDKATEPIEGGQYFNQGKLSS